jgi:hypothetical protein
VDADATGRTEHHFEEKLMTGPRYSGFLALFAGALLVGGGAMRAAPTGQQGERGDRDHGAEALVGAQVMRTVNAPRLPAASTANDLKYNGGSVGVEASNDAVYLVYWGSQWSSDPSGEAAIEQKFFNGVGNSNWNNTVTQYCEGVATGTVTCGTSGTHAYNGPSGFGAANVWRDTASAAPKHPTQSQLAAEAVNAAAHFGNTTAASNNHVQYIINTSHGNNMSGFGTQWCAWHSSTSSSYGTIAYTNMPYITDAGASCGANFNGLGPNAGITIVLGHEFAETETDPFPSSGWTDGGGAEIGDKCAWASSTANVTLQGGWVFPVQPLWSNAFNGGAGGCVLSYP